MYPSQTHLPFHTDEAYSGFAEVDGILEAERGRLILGYQVKDSILGVVKSGAKELIIPYDQLSAVDYQYGWFKSRFILKVRNMRILNDFPAIKDGTIILKIKRKNKAIAEDLDAYINLRIAEVGLEKLEENEV